MTRTPKAFGSAGIRTSLLLIVALLTTGVPTRAEGPDFPVQAEIFIDAFEASEGITFNGRGELFIAANRAVWRAEPDGSVEQLVELYTNLGQAGIGEADILQADFGLMNIFRDKEKAENDGIIWRVTPEGEKTVAAEGIADPNFILVLESGSYLVSDDGTDKIYLVTPEGKVRVWSDAIDYPNGMALSPDGSTLYVAQIFTSLDPIGFDDRLWALPVEGGEPAGEPRVVAETGEGGIDGLAMDELGRVYIADNGGGKIWRFDPDSEEMVLIAENMPHVASLVFGEGEFDHHSLYATATFRGGGTVYKVAVGVGGVRQYR